MPPHKALPGLFCLFSQWDSGTALPSNVSPALKCTSCLLLVKAWECLNQDRAVESDARLGIWIPPPVSNGTLGDRLSVHLCFFSIGTDTEKTGKECWLNKEMNACLDMLCWRRETMIQSRYLLQDLKEAQQHSRYMINICSVHKYRNNCFH